ncbi:hypothetical protein AY503_10545 [Corynebacterium diphtheriae bv. gravis]|nr:hypothetical protein AY505_07550 [Corynebacterium belfantii]OWN21998.1 hypothetical protein AY495_10955 [Corynebacterium diphtheriae bv. mitis]OWN26574.1 hypothetical protein AY503_10545 [Corynebacterium diphtheriae bv. gravis]OWN26636.1 hypothetical protein AY484_10875 [Corynebacterium belfantii]OWN33091.1 hypothetical protein AY487_10295 [Corynebacterium diphtheriae bv. mitis]
MQTPRFAYTNKIQPSPPKRAIIADDYPFIKATTITKKAITRHFARKDSPTYTPINGKDR